MVQATGSRAWTRRIVCAVPSVTWVTFTPEGLPSNMVARPVKPRNCVWPGGAGESGVVKKVGIRGIRALLSGLSHGSSW